MTFTPTQQRILKILSDGMEHTRAELWEAIDDELAGKTVLAVHLHHLRKKLEAQGTTIACISHGNRRKLMYRHVRLLTSSSQE